MKWIPRQDHRPARTHVAVIAFLVGFGALLFFLSFYYLLPATQAFLEARQGGDKVGVKAISATSSLLMSVVLLILIAGLMLTFRIGRFFFPRKSTPRTKTLYVDAWAESAKRLPTPSEEE